ncbi:MAG: class I SAM-dependent methyltransferase [Tepidiformaceae bacterium]
MADNEAQRQMWNAPARMASWKTEEPSLAGVAEPLLAAARPVAGENVLDLGCGGGMTTLLAAGLVGPRGRALGVDISEPMVELATGRAEAAGLSNVTFEVADAQTAVLPQAPFSLAMSRFGVMFFDDPVAAFSNVARHLQPGGRLAFACWQGEQMNRWFATEVLRKYRPAPPADDRPAAGSPAPGPFAFSDPEYVEGILTSAGFTSIGFARHEYEWRTAIAGPAFGELALSSLHLDSETHARAAAEMQAYEQGMVVDGVVVQKRAYFVVTANHP